MDGHFMDENQPASMPLMLTQNIFLGGYRRLPNPALVHLLHMMRVGGVLQREALRNALNVVARRHSSLCSRFVENDSGASVMVVGDAAECEMSFLSMEGSDEWRCGSLARAALDALVTRPFDLDRAPLFRVVVVSLSPQAHLLIMVIHHLISDNWSGKIILFEVARLYRAACDGVDELATQLPAQPTQFPQLAREQREWLAGPNAVTAAAYWRRRFSTIRTPFALRPDQQRDERVDEDSKHILRAIPRASLEALYETAIARPAAYFVMLAACAIVIAARSLDTNVVISVCHAGRPDERTRRTVGCMFDMWVLNVEIRDDMSFFELVQEVASVHTDSRPHRRLPYAKALGILDERGMRPHSRCIFNYIPVGDMSSGNLAAPISPADADVAAALEQDLKPAAQLEGEWSMALHFVVRESADELVWEAYHSPSQLSRAAAIELSEHYGAILERVARDPACRLAELWLS